MSGIFCKQISSSKQLYSQHRGCLRVWLFILFDLIWVLFLIPLKINRVLFPVIPMLSKETPSTRWNSVCKVYFTYIAWIPFFFHINWRKTVLLCLQRILPPFVKKGTDNDSFIYFFHFSWLHQRIWRWK